jgi:hypothetical protein
VVVIPSRASGSRLRNALAVIVLAGSFFGGVALLLEVAADISLYAVPVSVAVIAALLLWVLEPKVSTRFRAIVPDRRRVGTAVAWAVRALGAFGTLIVFWAVILQIPTGVFAAITLASGLLFLGGLLVALSESGPPHNRRERRRRLGGFVLIVLGMTFGGSFGVSLLFDFPYQTGIRRIIMWTLFGPIYFLGLPVFILGLWLLGILRRRA